MPLNFSYKLMKKIHGFLDQVKNLCLLGIVLNPKQALFLAFTTT